MGLLDKYKPETNRFCPADPGRGGRTNLKNENDFILCRNEGPPAEFRAAEVPADSRKPSPGRFQAKALVTKISMPIRIRMTPPTMEAFPEISVPTFRPRYSPARQMPKVTIPMISDSVMANGAV